MKWTNAWKGLLFIGLVLFMMPAKGQMEIQKGIEGKTFFDTAKTEVHEAYEYKIRYRMIINPKTGNAEPFGDPEEIKNGLYIRYRKDGTIECTGYYRNDVACGIWKYMDASGKVEVKEEDLGGDCMTAN
ncbi:MAG: hypothetical protein LPK45_11220 [Bacteroidota bacterium]|nr:hypothetical protein [Bacteroidota bacterium]MDX5431676.1 hypothetical protein [Bacteroidota bacterium]MDX5470391.1 hypothetical protein [Bacteroidota bacterium]